MYRSKLRDDLIGPEGEEVARQRIENYANQIRPPGFLVCTHMKLLRDPNSHTFHPMQDYIKIHSVDLGVSAPQLSNARLNPEDAHPDSLMVSPNILAQNISSLIF